MKGEAKIRPMHPGEEDVCEEIMRSIPEWFGIDEAIVQYRHDLEGMETFMADRDGKAVGFLTLNRHNPHSAEIHVMGIRKEFHRMGIGTALVRHAESVLGEDVAFLEVKTLGPSRENAEYAATRKFYLAAGFLPLEENKLWGDLNPCLILVKHLPCSRD